MVFYNNVIAGASGQTTGGGGDSSFKIEQSLRFDKAASAHLVRSFSTAGDRRRWTWSGWCKLSVLASSGNLFAAYGGSWSVDDFLQIYFSNASVIRIYGDNERYISDAVFRDPSAWYHIVVACDTTQSNAADRIKVYVNGVQHANQSSSPPGPNLEMAISNNVNHYHGSYNGSSELLGGYLAEVNFIDGAQLAPTAFGEFDVTTGVWNPIAYTGSYGPFGGRKLAASSGALPILNTSDDYGGTVASGVRSDSLSANLVLALPLNGSNGGTTITDYHHTIKGSGSAKAITLYTGSASGGAVTSTAESQFYGSSFYVVRGATNNYTASDYIARTGDSDLAFGTGSFCVEFWYRPGTFVQNSCMFDSRHNSTDWPNATHGFQFYTNHNGDLILRTGSSNVIHVGQGQLTEGQWHHLAVTGDYSGGNRTIRIFRDGTQVGTVVNNNDFSEGRFTLGSAANNGEGSNGYYADLRIYKGVAKYTSNFTVPEKGTGGVNSFRLDFDPNAGTNYSAMTVASNGGWHADPYGVDSGFNGIVGSGSGGYAQAANGTANPNSITFTPTGGIAYTSSVEVWLINNANTVSVNGGTAQSIAGTQWVTVASGSGTLTSLKFERASTNGASFGGIRIDGQDLINTLPPGVDAGGLGNHWTGNNLDMTGSPANNTIASHSHSGHSQGMPTDNFLDGQSGTAYTVVATSSNSTTTAVFTLGTTLNGTAEVLYHNGNSQVTGRISLDGGSNYTALSTTSSATWVNLGSMNSNEIRLRATFNTGGGSTAYFYGFRVNGTEVVTASDLKNLDSVIDTPTPYAASSGNNPGNYCTMSPIDQQGCTLTDGNLKITTGSSKCGRGTFWANSGKWYFEFEMTSYGNPYVGIASNGHLQNYVSHNSLCANNTGTIYDSNGGSQSYPGKTVAINAVGNYMVAFDLDNGKIWWGKNGTWYQQNSSANVTTTKSNVEAGNGATGFSSHPSFVSKDYWTVQFGSSTNACTYVLNAGQQPFKYPNSIPSGYKSLCTFNLEDPPFDNPAEAVDVVTFNGNSSGGSFQIPKFSPDLIWSKNRANGNTNHVIQDALRGFVDNKGLFPNLTHQEAGTGNITSVSDKTVNYGSNSNFTGSTVAWAWDAGEVANPVGDLWNPGAGKYFGVKFPTAGGGTISFGQTSGSNTVEVWSSSDNSSWTQQGGTLTLSSGHTITTSDRYILFKNTANATMSDVYVAATNGADGHYSGSNHGPSGGGSWSGPGYTDYDFRDPGGVLNKDGNTISIVRASASKGFSIVKWKNPSGNTTVGHGLPSSPHLILTKGLGTYEWMNYHRQLGSGYRFAFNNTTNKTGTSVWNSAHPSSSTFNFQDSTQMDWVAYCWTPIPGVSAMGQYEGGTSPFNYCGFRPHVVWIRNIDTGGEEFCIYDSERDPNNIAGSTLYSNSPGQEYDGTTNSYPRHIDILSNGFKATTGNPINQSATHIWVAFAESPFKYSRAR